MRGDEVLLHGKAFLEVRENRVFDDLTTGGTCLTGLGHQATHTGKLTDLVSRSTSTGVAHHVHGIEALTILFDFLHQNLGKTGVALRPNVNHLVVTLGVRDETHAIVHCNFINLLVGLIDQFGLGRRDDDVTQVKGETAFISHAVTESHDIVEEFGTHLIATTMQHVSDDVSESLLGQQLIDIRIIFGNHLIEEHTPHTGVNDFPGTHAVHIDTALDDSVKVNALLIIGNHNLFRAIENMSFTGHMVVTLGRKLLGHVIQTQHHVLGRHGNRSTIGRVENVVGGHHEHLGFHDGSIAQGHVHSHLVTIKVCVECRTAKRVQADSLAFHQTRLESLNTKTVQRRSTVQQHWMTLQNIFQNLIHDRILAVDNLLG